MTLRKFLGWAAYTTASFGVGAAVAREVYEHYKNFAENYIFSEQQIERPANPAAAGTAGIIGMAATGFLIALPLIFRASSNLEKKVNSR